MFLIQKLAQNGASTPLMILPIVCAILWKILLIRCVPRNFRTVALPTIGCVSPLKRTFLFSGSMDV